MKKILVTGGKGFIGSKIVEMLSKDYKVTVVDNHDTYGIMTKVELEKLYKWRTRNWNAKNVQVINGDILDRLTCLQAFSHRYVSSSMVYGDFKDGMKEDGKTKPKNIYGEAKLTGERMVKLFSKRDGLNYNIVRPSGVYGPGDMPDRVVSKFFQQAMNNDDITLHNGENKVDFTYRQDAARGIILAALSPVANVSFNITAGKATSLRTLAEKIIKLTNSESDIQDIGNHELYPMRGTLDISRAKDLLNYEPQFTLDQGLQSYYDWLQNKI